MSDRIILVSAVVSAAALLVAAAVVMLLREAAQRDLEARVGVVMSAGSAGATSTSSGGFGLITGLLRKVGEAVRRGTRLYSKEGLAELEGMIDAAGLHPKRVVPVVLGAKVVLLFLVPLAAFAYAAVMGLSPITRLLAIAGALPLGVLGPDWILRAVRRPYLKALRRGIADALDLLVVCTEAGMGLESALEQVATEMRHSNRAMAAALSRLVGELKVLPNRHEALNNFGQRSGVAGIRRMAAILSQTLQYGSPLGEALRAIASELRRERVTRLEEKAIRLPALLVFPLIFFIMPSFFVVMAGGPILRLMAMMHTQMGAK
jgi:tight adherence protein C